MKFVESVNVNGWSIKTDTGWEKIEKSHKTIPYTEWIIKTQNYKLICADEHRIFDENFNEIYVKDLKLGTKIQTETGIEEVLSIEETVQISNMYDLQLSSESNKRYYTNGILSHNTTAYAIYALHTICFNEDKRILILANKNSTAIEIVGKIRLAFELLPKWLKPGVLTWNKGCIELTNGCRVEGCPTSPDAARSKSANILIFDEIAFCPPNICDEVWASVYPIVSSAKGTKVIVVSTPNGTGNLYYEIWQKATMGESKVKENWVPFRIDWWDVPGRDEELKALQINSFNGDMKKWSQEFGNCFLGSSYTLVEGIAINEKMKEFVRRQEAGLIKTTELKFFDFIVNQFHEPIKDHCYVISADIGDGVGADPSTIRVLDITTPLKIIECASYNNNTTPAPAMAYILAKLGRMYNSAPIMVEANGMGRSVVDFLFLIYEYENLPSHGSKKNGILSNNKIKVEACLNFKKYFESSDIEIEINSNDIFTELEYFERKTTSDSIVYSAAKKRHDDVVMSWVWALYILDEAHNLLEYYFDVEYKLIGFNNLPVKLKDFSGSYSTFMEDKSVVLEKYDKTFSDIYKHPQGSSKELPEDEFRMLGFVG
jgi:hypothetical protein